MKNYFFHCKNQNVWVECREIATSLPYRFVQVLAANESQGVSAEYKWVYQEYPKSEVVQQSVLLIELFGAVGYPSGNRTRCDILSLRHRSGALQDIYFDISAFYGRRHSYAHG